MFQIKGKNQLKPKLITDSKQGDRRLQPEKPKEINLLGDETKIDGGQADGIENKNEEVKIEAEIDDIPANEK